MLLWCGWLNSYLCAIRSPELPQPGLMSTPRRSLRLLLSTCAPCQAAKCALTRQS